MKFTNVTGMKSYADRLVDRYVEAYKSDWTEMESKAFDDFVEESHDKKLSSALFIVRRCGTYLLPFRYALGHSRSELTVYGKSFAEYYADETLFGSKDNRFYLIDFEHLTITQKKAEWVKEMSK